MPGGGTSATAGTLTKNKYWHRGATERYFEDHRAGYGTLYTSKIWHKPEEGYWTEKLENKTQLYYTEYMEDAKKAGYDKAVTKIAWHLLWQPETFLCNEHVRPLLVKRHPVENWKSAHKRWAGVTQKTITEGQDQIQRLHEEYGWPIWEFHRNADLSELERIMGHILPIRHFEPGKVKNNVRPND